MCHKSFLSSLAEEQLPKSVMSVPAEIYSLICCKVLQASPRNVLLWVAIPLRSSGKNSTPSSCKDLLVALSPCSFTFLPCIFKALIFGILIILWHFYQMGSPLTPPIKYLFLTIAVVAAEEIYLSLLLDLARRYFIKCEKYQSLW